MWDSLIFQLLLIKTWHSSGTRVPFLTHLTEIQTQRTATNARATSEGEEYETTPMDNHVTHCGSRDPS
jgi:hypothetical protein